MIHVDILKKKHLRVVQYDEKE